MTDEPGHRPLRGKTEDPLAALGRSVKYRRFTLGSALAWTAVIGASMILNYIPTGNETEAFAFQEAIRPYQRALMASHLVLWLAGLAGIGLATRHLNASNRTRRESLEALRQSEERFRMLFDNMKSGVAVYRAVDDGDDFEFVDFNASALNLCMLSKEDVIGQRVTQVFPGTSAFVLLDTLREVWRDGGPRTVPLTQYKDGRPEQWLENYVFKLPTGHVVALFEDTSKQRKALEALRESESHHRHLVEAIPDILYRYSTQRGIIYASPQSRAILGFDPLDPRYGMRWHESIHPGEQAAVTEAMALAARGELFDIEYRVRDAAGAWHWFRDRSITCQTKAGETIIEGIATDITERKKAKAGQELLSRAIEQASDVVVITDQTGTIQYVNPAFERITGYTRNEALGQNPRILKSGHHDKEFYKEMWRTLTRGDTWKGRLINKKKDGTLFTEEGTITPVQDARGKVTNYVAVKRDITADLELREEKGKIEAQFRQAQKMEAVGQLAGGVAHDFNNLLQVINGYADLATERLDPKSEAWELLREVLKASDRAAMLVGQLLAFSRRQVMRLENLDLNSLVLDLMKMLGRVIGEHIRLDFVRGEKLDLVRADRGMLEQVLLNLCVNARDAMPEGGELTIETDNIEIGEEFRETHPWAETGHYVRLKVTDTGCGIGEDIQARLFEPFFTTKAVGEGSGLGLSMVYGTVKQHGGTIICTSEAGKGATFSIYLPRIEGIVQKAKTPSDKGAPGGDETILVVEDDNMVRELGRSILERAGYTVMTAEDGAAAIEVFQEHVDEFDLVLLDVVMPVMGGKEAYQRIQGIKPGMPAVFASGYSESAFSDNFLADENLTLIQKPFSRKVLLQAIRGTLDEARRT